MRSIVKFMAMCLAAMLSVLLAGCSSSDHFDWSMLQSDPAEAPVGSLQQEQAPSRDSLMLYMPEKSGVFDPLVNESAQMQELFSLVFEGLLRVDEQGKIEPWLVEKMERTETGWRFTLRSGVKFQDGTLLSAQDVVNTFTRLQQAGEEGPYAFCLSYILSMSAVDNSTLDVETAGGYGSLYALCFPVGRYPESSGLPKGTGPYRVDSYLAGAELRLAASENWWRKPPLLTSIAALPQKQAPTAELVQAGTVDVALVELAMTSSLYGCSHVAAQDYLTGRVDLLLPNLEGTLGDETLRRAIAGLLDRRDLIANAYQNHAVAVEIPVWPDSFLFEQVDAGALDPKASRSLLSAVGWSDLDGDGLVERTAGLETPQPSTVPEAPPTPVLPKTPTPGSTPVNEEVTVEKLLGLDGENKGEEPEHLTLTLLLSDNGSSGMLDTAARLRTQLLNGGIELKIENLSMDELQTRIQKGEYDLLLTGYQLGASGDLSALLSSDGANNLMQYKSEQMDIALQSLQAANTAEQYQVAAQRVFVQIEQDLPVFSLVMRSKTRITANGLDTPGIGRQGDSLHGIENWSFKNVEK